jgi:predicted small lipoprotein YifL
MGVSFALAGALSACGKKGPLELPPPEPVIGDEPGPNDDPGAQQ